MQSLRGRPLIWREIPSFLTPIWEMVCGVAAVIALLLGKIFIGVLFVCLFCVPIVLYALRLYTLAQGSIGLLDALRFYGVYFPARAIGTTLGIFRVIKS
ncbi:hypothetical protein GF339_05260 [candidate division KSB3 bacterium]|uniref:Uncharacterized protein n=1 Tax=candidate division KSB3 bacterium TaxID=2044937 RepID=A0A9D5Q4W3_9BACT|nr:hypothetical protein [candidate division KSB3 bacterium]MBD3323970.1 hypothetical protein [candidate division KSB3 bacterium]